MSVSVSTVASARAPSGVLQDGTEHAGERALSASSARLRHGVAEILNSALQGSLPHLVAVAGSARSGRPAPGAGTSSSSMHTHRSQARVRAGSDSCRRQERSRRTSPSPSLRRRVSTFPRKLDDLEVIGRSARAAGPRDAGYWCRPASSGGQCLERNRGRSAHCTSLGVLHARGWRQ